MCGILEKHNQKWLVWLQCTAVQNVWHSLENEEDLPE